MYKSLSGEPANTEVMGGEGQFITNDGMFINIQNSEFAVNGLSIIVDVNGYRKGPNVYGRDTFAFQILNDRLVPMGVYGTLYNDELYCDRNSNGPLQGISCAYYVITGKDY